MISPVSLNAAQTSAPSSGGYPCEPVRSALSSYLDGAVTGIEMQQIADHLDACPACAAEFALTRSLQQTLSTLGPSRMPSDLSLRLRLAISHEGQRTWSSRLQRLTLNWHNAFRPLVMQASAGLAGAVLFLGSILFLLGAMSAANPVMANDEPLGAMTSPHYLYSVAGIQPVTTVEDSTIVVEAAVNARGQVYDYRIVSGPQDAAVRNQVVERLLSSVFRPASVFGVPIRGHVVMTFAGISVRG